MNKEILNAILRADFKSFVIKVFNTVSAGSNYLDNWHVDVICDELMNMCDGGNNRLIINIPPRYMKSIICSIALPAFLLGHDPKTNMICVSYSDDLSTKFANDCRNVMLSEWYRELFPMARLHQSRRATNDFQTTAGGGRMSTSIGGTLTGRGADWIIIDDPLKPFDAMSENQRDKVNDWYGSTLYSRLNDKNTGKILLIMQRLHQSDLTGHLLESGAKFKLIKLPVIAEQDEKWVIKNRHTNKPIIIKRNVGELLHPERENMDIITDMRSTLGEFAFAGQYQQRPSPASGGLVKKEWLHYYNELPRFFENIYISWDTATKTGPKNAFSACVIFGVGKNKKIYVLNVFRERMNFPTLLQKVKQTHCQTNDTYKYFHQEISSGYIIRCGYSFVKTIVEDASSGVQILQQLKSEREISTVSRNPDRDKETRLSGISSHIENGTVLFPATSGPWWKDFANELFMFPNSTFKDQCDAFSQGIEYIAERHIIRPYYTKII